MNPVGLLVFALYVFVAGAGVISIFQYLGFI